MLRDKGFENWCDVICNVTTSFVTSRRHLWRHEPWFFWRWFTGLSSISAIIVRCDLAVIMVCTGLDWSEMLDLSAPPPLPQVKWRRKWVISNTPSPFLVPLQQQKKAVRILNFVKYSDRRQPSKPLFEKSKILPLDKNLSLISGKIMWKAANSMLCPSLSNLFTQRDGNNTFHTPFKRLDVSHDSVTYAGTMSWNAIPSEIRSAPSLQNFKQKYREHLLSTLWID